MIPMQKRPRRRNDSSTETRAPKHGRRHTDTETRGSKHGHRNMGTETRAPKHGHRNTDAETRAPKRERQNTDAELRAPKHESRDTSAEKRTSRHSCPIVPVLSITESTTVSTINIASSNGIDISSNDVAPLSPPAAYKQTVQSAEQMALDALVAKVKPSSYGRRRNYSSIDISAEKWLMHYDAESLAKLENPPSLADGIGRELERDIRYLGCELIQSGAILLRLNQTSAATAQILFQRYYYLKSFVRYNFEHMVQACLLLASKIEEEPRKPRDVLNVYNRLRQIHHRRGAAASSQHPEAVQKLSKKWMK